MAWQDHLYTVQKLYVAYYQRPADPVGLRYWAQAIEDYGIDAAVRGFVNSPEAQALYGGDINAVITAVYRSAFGREPEPEGLNYWRGVYERGWATLGTIVWTIVSAAKGIDAIVLSNKLTSAMNFTKAIDPELDGLGPFNATYDANDLVAAREFLRDVTATSVKTEHEALIYVQSKIADSGDPITQQPTPTQGKTFVLTPQIDVLTGTNYDDVFIGDNSSLFNPTVQVGDQINGGGGNDILRLYGFTSMAAIIPNISSVETVEFVFGAPTQVNTTSFSDLTSLRIKDVLNLANNVTITYLSGQSVELVNIKNAATQTITITPFDSKVADVIVSGVVEKVDATNQTVTDLILSVPQAVTTLNITSLGSPSDITVSGLAGGEKLNIKGKADIVVNFTQAPDKIFINASSHEGTVTLRLDNINYAPLADNRLSGVDKIVIFSAAGTTTLDLSNQTEGFEIVGSKGKDIIHDSSGDSVINAGAGNDLIFLLGGYDEVTGGKGKDVFVFTDFSVADTIKDFNTIDDTIYLDLSKNLVGTKRTTNNKVRVLTINGGTASISINQAYVPGLGGTPLANSLTDSQLFVAANTAKLISNVVNAANGGGGANNDFAVAFGRTTVNNKLYLILLSDANIATSGGAKFVKIITLVNVGANFAAGNIFIF